MGGWEKVEEERVFSEIGNQEKLSLHNFSTEPFSTAFFTFAFLRLPFAFRSFFLLLPARTR